MPDITLDRKTRIQVLLRQRGSSQADIARRLGEEEGVVSRIIGSGYGTKTEKGRRRRSRVLGAIAEVIGVPVREIDEEATEQVA